MTTSTSQATTCRHCEHKVYYPSIPFSPLTAFRASTSSAACVARSTTPATDPLLPTSTRNLLPHDHRTSPIRPLPLLRTCFVRPSTHSPGMLPVMLRKAPPHPLQHPPLPPRTHATELPPETEFPMTHPLPSTTICRHCHRIDSTTLRVASGLCSDCRSQLLIIRNRLRHGWGLVHPPRSFGPSMKPSACRQPEKQP